jgi:TRAP-type C4-dicarboxylate transport system substrate-binding protein
MNTTKAILRFAIVSAVCGVALAQQQPRRVKLATLAPKGSSIHQILQAMGEEWRQAPGGGVPLTVYTDGTMGGEAEIVRRMRVDQLQAALVSVAGLEQIDRSVNALQSMPMIFRSLDEVDYVRERMRPLLDKRLEEKGFVALFWGDAGWVRSFSKTPVSRPGEAKKLKMFALSGDTGQIDLMKSVGFQPVPLEYTDTLTGLQTGLIEIVPTIPFYALAGQLYLAAPYMLEINYAPLTGALVMTRKAWDALSPVTREAMQRAAEEAGKKIRIQSRKEMDESVTAMKKRGLKVNQMTPQVEAEWQALFDGVYPKLRGNLVPADMFDEVQRLLREYRK